MTRYELNIDSKACWGCLACEVACKQENQVPCGIKYISVGEEGPKKVDGRLDMIYQITVCRHCERPECAAVCPEEAITKQEETGFVILDQEICSGCGTCLEACPFQAITLNHLSGKAYKCHLCFHRVKKGLLPACADNVCLAQAITFKAVSSPKIPMIFRRRGALRVSKTYCPLRGDSNPTASGFLKKYGRCSRLCSHPYRQSLLSDKKIP